MIEYVKKVIAERGVFPKFVALLSDGSYWLPNCGGDVNGGGVLISPSGDTIYMCNYIDENDDLVTPLDYLAAEGVTVVDYPFR